MDSSRILWSLVLYGLACSLSISAMGLFSTLLLLMALYALLRKPEARARFLENRAIGILGLAWVLSQALHLAVLPWDERSSHVVKRLPLLLVPIAPWLALNPLRPTEEQKERLVRLSSLGVLLATVFALYQFLTTRGPAGGFMKNSIYWAYGLLAFGIFLGQEAFDSTRARRARIALVGFVAVFVGALLSLNRVVPLVLGVFVLFHLPRRRILPFLAVSLAALGLLYVASPFLQEKVSRSLTLLSDPSFQWRGHAWRHNWELFLANPFFGVGPEKNALDPNLHPSAVGRWAPGHLYFAHNVFLQSLADSGLVGSLLFFGFFLACARRFPRTRVLLLASAVAGLFENTWNNSKALHPFLFALAALILFSESEREAVA